MGKYLKYLSLGADAFMLVEAVMERDSKHFGMAIQTLLADVGQAAKIKELSPEMLEKIQPLVAEIFSIVTQEVAKD